MKAETIAAVVCSALALPYVVFGQQSPSPADQSIDGDWIITFQAQGRSVSGNLRFKSDGERLTGTVETTHTGPGTIQNGKWSQQKISATFVFEKHEAVVLEGELKVDGTLSGNYQTEDRTDKWQAVRSAKREAQNGKG